MGLTNNWSHITFYFVLIAGSIKINQGFLVNNDTNCVQLLTEVDSMVKATLYMKDEPIFPTNETLRNEYCKPYKTLVPSLIRLSRCLPPFLTQVALIFGYGQRRTLKSACGTKDPEIFKYYQCINSNYTEQLQRTTAIYLNSLSAIKDNATDSDTIPALCCSTKKVLENIRNLSTPECPSGQKVDVSSYLTDRISDGLDDFLTLVCSSFPDFSSCQRKWSGAVQFLSNNESPIISFDNSTLVPSFLSIMNKLTT